MKKKNTFLRTFLPVIITVSLYLVFYSKIASKPVDAGFWFILAMGMAIGAAISSVKKNTNDKVF